jgi:hypothetical protein
MKLLILGLLFCASSLHSEIQTVEVKWEENSCRGGCIKLLEERLKETKEIKSFNFDASGKATIIWQQKEPFTFKTIRNPVQRAGANLSTVDIVVRGKVNVSHDKTILTSVGDNTRFILINYSHYLSARSDVKLDPNLLIPVQDSLKKNEAVIVKGTLFQPYRPGDLFLQVDSIEAVK